MAFNPAEEKNTQTFAFSLIPKNGMPIDRSTVVSDESELKDFVDRGWIFDGAKTFIKSKGKACTVKLDASAPNGYVTVDEVDVEQVNSLATAVVTANAPSKDDFANLSAEVDKVDAKVEAEVQSIKETNTKLEEQLTAVELVTNDYQEAKNQFATKIEVQETVESVDLTPYATHGEVAEAKTDVLNTVSKTYATTEQLNTILNNHNSLKTRVQTLEGDNVELHKSVETLEKAVTSLQVAIEEISKKLLVQPSELEAVALLEDGTELVDSSSVKYGKKITSVKVSWVDGDATIPVQTVRVKVGSLAAQDFEPVNGGTYTLSTPYTVTANTNIVVEAVYSIATLTTTVTLFKTDLVAPVITSFTVNTDTGLSRNSNGSLLGGTKITTGEVVYKSGDSNSYTITIGDTVVTKAVDKNTANNRSGVVDFQDVVVPETVGETVKIKVTIHDNENPSVADVVKELTFVSEEQVFPCYFGSVAMGETLTKDAVQDTHKFTTADLKAGGSHNLYFNDGSDPYTLEDFVIVLPDGLELDNVKYENDFESGDCTSDFEEIGTISIDTVTYTEYRKSTTNDGSLYTVTVK